MIICPLGGTCTEAETDDDAGKCSEICAALCLHRFHWTPPDLSLEWAVVPTDTVAVSPAIRRVFLGSGARWIRTGMRCASRTQLKVGFTFGSKLLPVLRSRSTIPAARLSTVPDSACCEPISVTDAVSFTWMKGSLVSSK